MRLRKQNRFVATAIGLMVLGMLATEAVAGDEEKKVIVKKIRVGHGEDHGEHQIKGKYKIVIGDDAEETGEREKHIFIHSAKENGGFLGVGLTELTPELRAHFGAPDDRGVMVSKVMEDSAAAAAGVQVGDIILAVEGEPSTDGGALAGSVSGYEAGESVSVELWREGAAMTVSAVLGERPDHGMHQGHKVVKIMKNGGDGHVIHFGKKHHATELDCPEEGECEIEIECDGDECDCAVNGEAMDCEELPLSTVQE